MDLGSNPLRLSFLFKSYGLLTLSCDFVHHNRCNIKMALDAAHLNVEVILVAMLGLLGVADDELMLNVLRCQLTY